MSVSDEKLDRLIDLLERQFTSRWNRRGDFETYTDDKQLFDMWKKFSAKARQDIEDNYNLLLQQHNEKRKAIIDTLGKEAQVVKEIMDLLKQSTDMTKPESDRASAFDKAISDMEKTYDKTKNPAIKKFFDSLEKISELSDEISKGNVNLDETRSQFDTLYRESKRRVGEFFANLKMQSATYERSPWMIILSELIHNKNSSFLNVYFSMLGAHMEKYLNPLNLFLQTMTWTKRSTIDLVKSLDQVDVSFLKTTGLSSKFRSDIRDTWSEVRYLGVSLEETAKANEIFRNKMSQFSTLSASQRVGIAAFASTINRLGVSLEDSATATNFFFASLKRGTSGSQSGVRQLLSIADNLGESMSKVTSEFVQNIPVLAKWGQQIDNVFAQIQAVRKSLNLTTQEVMQIAEGFDTFDSAAQSVGRLNAILGGPFLNTMQLLNSNEADIIRQLHESFRMSGKSWEALSRHEKQAIANAAGIRDMDLAQRLFTGSLADVNQHLAKQSLTQDELNERARRATTIGEKFNMVLSSMAIAFEPIVDVLQFVMDLLVQLSDNLKWATIPAIFLMIGAGRGLIGLLMNLGGALIGLLPKFLSLIPGLSGLTGAMGGAGLAIKGFATSMASILPVAGPAAASILLIGGAIAVVVGIFVGFLKVADGISEFFSGLGQGFKTNMLTQFTSSIGDMSKDIPGKLQSVTDSVTQMSNAISSIPSANIGGYIDLMNSIEDIATAAQSNVATNFINSIRDIAMNAFQLSPQFNSQILGTIQTDNQKNDVIQNLMNKLDTIIEALTTSKGKTNQPIKIAVEMDGDVLAEKVIDVINDYGRLR